MKRTSVALAVVAALLACSTLAGAAAPASVALQSHSGNMLRWAAEFPHAMAVMRVAAPDGSVSKRKFGAEQLCGRGDVGVYPSSKS